MGPRAISANANKDITVADQAGNGGVVSLSSASALSAVVALAFGTAALTF